MLGPADVGLVIPRLPAFLPHALDLDMAEGRHIAGGTSNNCGLGIFGAVRSPPE